MTSERRGGRPSTSADRALAHIDNLLRQCPGLTRSHIMHLAGLGRATIVSIRATGRLAIETEEAILAVQPRHVALRPPPHLPAAPAIAHLRQIMGEARATMDDVMRATGIRQQTIRLLLQERWSILNSEMYAQIMALSPEDLRSVSPWTDRRPSIIRVRALQANGHSFVDLGRKYRIKVRGVVATPDQRISVDLADRVLAMYRDIGDRPGDSTRARNLARSLGYWPPIYYDDDMNLIRVAESAERRRQMQARTDLCILGLTVENRSVQQIVEVLGVHDRRVSAVRRQHGLTIGRAIDGGFEAVESAPGVIKAIRAAVRDVHYRSTLDVLDAADLDYVDLLSTIRDTATAATRAA